MVNTANEISRSKVRSSILSHGIFLAAFYIVFFLIMKFFNLVYITELRVVNYIVLFLTAFYQLKKLVDKGKNYVPYLRGFGAIFFTGILSSLLFSIFLFVYGKFDPDIDKFFWENIPLGPVYSLPIPYITIFFEGSAISIIAALTVMQYFRKYEEGEGQAFNVSSKKTDLSTHHHQEV
jgi:hypothetical protein